MSALQELLSNQHWMIHDLVDGNQIDNEEEKRLLDVYEKAKVELASLRAERDEAVRLLKLAENFVSYGELEYEIRAFLSKFLADPEQS